MTIKLGVVGRQLVVAVMLCIASGSVAAFEEAYIGGNLGTSALSGEADDADGQTINYTANDIGFKIVSGYRASRYLAFEVGYVDYGQFSDTNAGTEVRLSPYALGVWAVGTLPLLERFELFARGGWGFWRAAVETRDASGRNTDRRDGSDLAYGVGAGMRLGEAFALRVEWDVIDIERTDGASLISIGAYYLFR